MDYYLSRWVWLLLARIVQRQPGRLAGAEIRLGELPIKPAACTGGRFAEEIWSRTG